MDTKPTYNRWIVALCIFLLLGVLFVWVPKQVDQWLYPWGYASSGKPTLTGTWVGPLAIDGGQRLGMLVEIRLIPLGYTTSGSGTRRPSSSSVVRRNWLDGHVLVCAAPGRIQHFAMEGKPNDRRAATHFSLSASPVPKTPLEGLSPSHIRGQWRGKDSIMLLVSLHWRRGISAISGPDYPGTTGETPAMLVRASEADFISLCSGLEAP